MTAIYSRLPNVLGDIVAKNLHELSMADVMTEFRALDIPMLRLEIIMQHYASQGYIRIVQFSGGRVGQEIYLIHPLTEDGNDMTSGNVGRSWNTFDEQADAWMTVWREEGSVTEADPEYHYTDEDWYDYSNWNIHYGDGLSRVRIMLQCIPEHPDFAELDMLHSEDNFITQYPGFIPVFITVPNNCISNIEIPLNTIQLSIKHGFKETASIISTMMKGMNEATLSQTHDIFASIMEHLIMHPAILIYAPHFRAIFYKKLNEMRDHIRGIYANDAHIGSHSTRSFHKKYARMERIVNTMYDVMRGIRSDPNYVH